MIESTSSCTTSIGSSIVTMCVRRVRLMCPIIEAIVVVLPVPVGPVINTSPRGESPSASITGGSRSSSNVGTSLRTRRIAKPTTPRWRNTLTRKRPTPVSVVPRSASLVSENSRFLCSDMSNMANDSVSVEVSTSKSVGVNVPSTLMKGTFPTLRCRSLAPRSTVYRSSSSISMPDGIPSAWTTAVRRSCGTIGRPPETPKSFAENPPA